MIGSAVHCQCLDDFQYHIFGINTRRKFSDQIDHHGFRLTKTTHALENCHLQISCADPGRKRTEGAVSAGMTVTHNHSISRMNKSLFRKKGMTHAIATDIKEIFYSMTPCPIAHNFSLSGRLAILWRSHMIDNCCNFIWIKNSILSLLHEIQYSNWRRNLMAHYQINIQDYISWNWSVPQM